LPDNSLVSIIIVNYNAGRQLQSCLNSIRKQFYSNWEVIIIDNASQDDSLTTVPSDKAFQVIRNRKNMGFSIAQNQGLRAARGDYLLPLNFDINMLPDFLEELVKAIETDSQIGSVTGKLLYMGLDGAITNKIYSVGHLLPRNRAPLLRGNNEIDLGQYDRAEYVFGAPGAAVLFRKTCLEDIAYQGQYFDETYFMWYEDVDMDWRIQLRGWKCLYEPKAVGYHVGHPGGYDANFLRFHSLHSIRNRWAMISSNEKKNNLFRNFTHLLSYEISLLGYVVRFGLLTTYLQAFAGYLKLLPTIINKRRWVLGRAVVSMENY
jgi:GT2 family glycosyltransferase